MRGRENRQLPTPEVHRHASPDVGNYAGKLTTDPATRKKLVLRDPVESGWMLVDVESSDLPDQTDSDSQV